MGNGMKIAEGTWFTNAADLILDSVGETRIEMMTQGAIAISPNLGRNSVEVNHIAIYTMGVLHAEMIKLVLGISNGVMWTKHGLELYDEPTPAGHPQGTCVGVIHSQ